MWCFAVPEVSRLCQRFWCVVLCCARSIRCCAKGFGVWSFAVPGASGAVPKALVCDALLCQKYQVLCQRLWCVVLCCAWIFRCCANGLGVWCCAWSTRCCAKGFGVWYCAVPGAPGAVPKVMVCVVLRLERHFLNKVDMVPHLSSLYSTNSRHGHHQAESLHVPVSSSMDLV